MGLMSGIESPRVRKIKARLGYNWKKLTPDEIDLAIISINVILESTSYDKDSKDLALKLRKKMQEQIPEYMI